MSAQAKFLTGDLMRHVTTMSAAGSVGLMAIFLVDLADLYFISLLGEQELAAAVAYAGAVMFFTTSVSIGLAIAMGALVARSLGADEAARARRYQTTVLSFSLTIAVAVAVAVWLATPQLVVLVGAEGRTADLATEYLRIVVPSLPALFCMMSGGAVLRAHGDASRAMNATLACAAVNAVLDPILIFGAGLELQGAALASVAARVAGAIVAFAPIFSRYGGFAPFSAAALWADLPTISRLAFPAMLTNVATPIGAAFVTREIASFGDSAVAGFAIVSRLTPVVFGVVFALSGAIGPIVAQNFGARRYDRVRGALRASLVFLGVYVVVASVILFLGRDGISAAFDASPDARTLIYWFCGPLSLLFFFNGVLFAANASFNNLERPFTSTAFNWARHTIGTIPPAILGGWLLGAPGVMLGQALGGVAFALWAMRDAYRLVDRHESGEVNVAARRATLWRPPLWPFSSPRA